MRKYTTSIRKRHRKKGGALTMRKKTGIGKIIKAPRVVILDNDETTGSYWVMFSIIHIFRDYQIGGMHLQDIIPALADFAIQAHIFRPGLVKLLKTLYKLRGKGLLDAIVMYTYQTTQLGRKDDWGEYYNSTGQQVHMPRIIDYCFGYLTTGTVQPFSNLILTREDHRAGLGLKESDSLGPKSVELVFKKLNILPTNDLRGLVFIDDCYLNMPLDKKYIVGPLTAMYIKDYRTIMSEVPLIFNSLHNLYTSALHKYISKSQFDEFMERMNKHKIDDFAYYSECSPKGVPFTYDKTDMTKLATLVEKYYNSNKF